MPAWLSGRERVVTFEGITSGSFHKRAANSGFPVNIWDENDASLSVYCNGCAVRAYSFYDGAITFRWIVSVDNILGGSQTSYAERTLPNTGDEWNLDLSGFWRVTGTAEEVLEAEVLGVWPTYGGLPAPDAPYETVFHARERWKPGTTLTVEASIGGVSVSLPVEVTAANTRYLEYGSELTAWCEALEYSGAMASTHVFKWTSAFGNGSYELGSDSYQAAAAKHTATAASGVAVTAAGPSSRTEQWAAQWAPRSCSLDIALRRMEDPLPGDASVRVNRRASGPDILNARDGVLRDTFSQRRYAAVATFWEFLFGSWQRTGPNPGEVSPADYQDVDEYADLYAYMDPAWLSAQREDRRDWRLLMRGRTWDALTLLQDRQHVLDDCSTLSPPDGAWEAGANTTLAASGGVVRAAASGGAGSATRRWTPENAMMQSYRFLRLRMRSTAGANLSLTLHIGAKSWQVSTGPQGEWVERDVDLCAPANCAVDADGMDSRWPVPTDDDHVDQEGAMWGVSRADALTISGIPDGAEVEIDTVSLVRLGWSRATFLPAFRHWAKAVTAEDNDQYNRRLLLCDTDGRQSVEEHDMILFADTGGYAVRTISSLAADVNSTHDPADQTLVRYPGWRAVEAQAFPDVWHNNGNDAVCLMGGGARYVRAQGAADPGWVFAFDEPAEAEG
jgi:hypothetical protein